MSFVFLSHAAPDKPKIRHLADALIAAGIKVWVDNPAAMNFSAAEIEQHFIRIKAGGRWRDEIDDALRAAGAVLVCWSEKAAEGERTVLLSEVTVARTYRKLVACRVDDVDPATLPDDHGQEQIPDLRIDLPADTSTSRLSGSTRRPRAEAELETALQLLIQDIKLKLKECAGRRIENRILRDTFVPYLINRTDQEEAFAEAIADIMTSGGVRPFIVAGPENECPDEFLERLKRHTSPKCLNGRTWYDIHVEWPFDCLPSDFPVTFQRRLAAQLRLPSTASQSEIAQHLSQNDRCLAVISLMHAEEWKIAEPKRIKAWLRWWQVLAEGPHRFSAMPILCLKMGLARPGWKTCPRGSCPGATVSNAGIWREARRLAKFDAGFSILSILGGRRAKLLRLCPLPILRPVKRPDADRWTGCHFEIMSADRRVIKLTVEKIFESSAAIRHGVALRDFAEAVRSKFSENG